MQRRVKITFALYTAMVVSFTAFHIAFGLAWIYGGDEKPCEFDRIVGVINVIIYIPFDFCKAYLAVYFWRLGLRYLSLMSVTNHINIGRVEIILILTTAYQVIQNILMMAYWIYPMIMKFENKPSEPSFTRF